VHPQRNAARTQQVELLHTQLQRVITEYIGDSIVEIRLFARKNILTGRRFEPRCRCAYSVGN